MAGMKDVAQRAGVSIATVSRYINQTSAVDPAKAQAIEEAMAFYQYAPSQFGRGLVTQKTQLIGVYFPAGDTESALNTERNMALLRGLDAALRDSAYTLLLLSEASTASGTAPRYISFVRQKKIDALVLTGPDTAPIQDSYPEDAYLQEMLTHKFPLSTIGQALPNYGIHVFVSLQKVLLHALDVLSDAGHTHILCILDPALGDPEAAMQSLREALPALQLELCVLGEKRTLPWMRQILQQHVVRGSVTALCVPSVAFCHLLYAACGSLGLTIPEQLSIIALERRADEGLGTYPPTSTVCVQTSDMGLYAGRLLLNALQKKTIAQASVEISSEYIARQTVRPYKAKK